MHVAQSQNTWHQKMLDAQSMFNLKSADRNPYGLLFPHIFREGKLTRMPFIYFFSNILSQFKRTNAVVKCVYTTRLPLLLYLLEAKELEKGSPRRQKGGTEVAGNSARDERKLISGAAAPQTALITQG